MNIYKITSVLSAVLIVNSLSAINSFIFDFDSTHSGNSQYAANGVTSGSASPYFSPPTSGVEASGRDQTPGAFTLTSTGSTLYGGAFGPANQFRYGNVHNNGQITEDFNYSGQGNGIFTVSYDILGMSFSGISQSGLKVQLITNNGEKDSEGNDTLLTGGGTELASFRIRTPGSGSHIDAQISYPGGSNVNYKPTAAGENGYTSTVWSTNGLVRNTYSPNFSADPLNISFSVNYNNNTVSISASNNLVVTRDITGSLAEIDQVRLILDGSMGAGDYMVIDNFSIVPEPSTYALLAGFAAFLFVAVKRRK